MPVSGQRERKNPFSVKNISISTNSAQKKKFSFTNGENVEKEEEASVMKVSFYPTASLFGLKCKK